MISVLGAGDLVIPAWAPWRDYCFSSLPSMRVAPACAHLLSLLSVFWVVLLSCIAACPLSMLCCKMTFPSLFPVHGLCLFRNRAEFCLPWLHRDFGSKPMEKGRIFHLSSFLRTKGNTGQTWSSPLCLTTRPVCTKALLVV